MWAEIIRSVQKQASGGRISVRDPPHPVPCAAGRNFPRIRSSPIPDTHFALAIRAQSSPIPEFSSCHGGKASPTATRCELLLLSPSIAFGSPHAASPIRNPQACPILAPKPRPHCLGWCLALPCPPAAEQGTERLGGRRTGCSPRAHPHGPCVCAQPDCMSILLEGTWISHPHPTDGLCDAFPGKADLSQKSQFVPEQEERLRPFFSLPCLKHLKKLILLFFFRPPLERKADESI